MAFVWNSCSQAARAALEILIGAKSVHLAAVDPDVFYFTNDGEAGADTAAYLSGHGSKLVAEQLASGERPTREIMRHRARTRLRSRLRVPVFMAG